MWQRTFLGVSVLLGERVDDACAALGEAAALPAVATLARTLQGAPRPVRARALAEIAEHTLRDVREATFR